MAERRGAGPPTIADQLGYLSLRALKQMVRALRAPTTGTEHGELVQALAPLIGTEQHHALLRRALLPDDWSLLTLLPVRAHPVTLRTLIGALRQRGLPGNAAVAPVVKLLQHGALLPIDIQMAGNKISLDASSLMG